MNKLSKLSFLFVLVTLIVACKPKGEKSDVSDPDMVAEAAGKTYQVNTTNSKVMWTASKVTGQHNGTIAISDGSISMEDGVLQSGNFTIDMNSITVLDLEGENKDNLENHLKGTVEGKEVDFFNAPKFPTGTFEITKVARLMNNDEGNYVINGNLTLKGISKQISFKAMVVESNGTVTVTTPSFTIDRTEWGVNYRSTKFFDDLKDNAIYDEIGLVVSLTAS